MGLFKEKEEQNTALDDLKNQIFERINTLNNMLLDVKNQVEQNTEDHAGKITDIQKAFNVLDEDIYEISERVDKKSDNIKKINKNFSDLKVFAKLTLKNRGLIDQQKGEIALLRKEVFDLKKQIAKKEVVIPQGPDSKKDFEKLQNQINDLKSGTIIVEKSRTKKKTK
ncbi:MAG: hypothetical protein KAR87_06340 [Candidatus Aenigmarchaeota archaeon]|nr:hypothetical protein [Candidatus Aenigmarchaeota archaeon]